MPSRPPAPRPHPGRPGPRSLRATALLGVLVLGGLPPLQPPLSLPFVAAPAMAPPAAATGAGVATVSTGNWSGYVATSAGGAFSGVTGRFDVPWARHAPAGSTVSQWVGVDGWDSSTLVQAGVDVVAQAHAGALVEPWWEVVPGPQHLATGVMARPGDLVAVTLSRSGPEAWSIALTDQSRQESFSTTVAYTGPASSAEWVVEAVATATGQVTRLAPYSPAVTFSDLGLAGAQGQVTRVVMAQSGSTVSAPSALGAGGFAVTYSRPVPAPAPVPPTT